MGKTSKLWVQTQTCVPSTMMIWGEKISIYDAMKDALEITEMKKLPGVTER